MVNRRTLLNIVYDSFNYVTIPHFTYFQEVIHQYIIAQNINVAQFKDKNNQDEEVEEETEAETDEERETEAETKEMDE